MPTLRHGKNTVVLLGSSNASPYLNDASTNRSVDTNETSAFGNSAKTYLTGQGDGTIAVKGMFDGTALAIDALLQGFIASETDPIVSISIEGNTVGAKTHMAKVKETTYETSSPVSDIVSISADFQVDGGIDSGRLLAPATSVSTATTTNGTAVDNAALTSNGGVAHVHVTANVNLGTTTVKVQHSTDNSTWVDLVTFTTIATTVLTSERIEVAASTTVNRYLRSQITTTGTGNITSTIAFARR